MRHSGRLDQNKSRAVSLAAARSLALRDLHTGDKRPPLLWAAWGHRPQEEWPPNWIIYETPPTTIRVTPTPSRFLSTSTSFFKSCPTEQFKAGFTRSQLLVLCDWTLCGKSIDYCLFLDEFYEQHPVSSRFTDLKQKFETHPFQCIYQFRSIKLYFVSNK